MTEAKQQLKTEALGQDESLVSDKEVQKTGLFKDEPSGLFKDEKIHVKVHRRVF